MRLTRRERLNRPKPACPSSLAGAAARSRPGGGSRSLLRAAAPRALRRSRGGEAPPRTTFVIYLIRKLNYLKARKTRKTLVFTSLSRRLGNFKTCRFQKFIFFRPKISPEFPRAGHTTSSPHPAEASGSSEGPAEDV